MTPLPRSANVKHPATVLQNTQSIWKNIHESLSICKIAGSLSMDAQVTVKCSVYPSQQTLSKLRGANKLFSENLFYIWNKIRPCREAHPFFQVDLSSKTFFESPQCGLNQRKTESLAFLSIFQRPHRDCPSGMSWT